MTTLAVLLSLIAISCGEMTVPTGPTTETRVVKTISKYSLDVNTFKKQNLLFKKEYDREGHIVSFLEYDSQKNVSSRQTYNYSEEKRNDTLFLITDSGLEKIESITVSYLDLNTGRIKSKIEKNSSGDTLNITSYEYDSNGNISKITKKNPITGTVGVTRYTSEYNNRGQLIARDTYTDSELVSKEQYDYSNNTDNSITVTNTLFSGNMSIVQYSTGNDGRLLNEIRYDEDYEVIEAFEYEYEYFD